MLLSWDIDFDAACTAYDFITDHGKKHMDCTFDWSLFIHPEFENVLSFFLLFRQSLFGIHEEILSQWNTQTSIKPWPWLNKIFVTSWTFSTTTCHFHFFFSLSYPTRLKITLHFLQHIHHSIMICVWFEMNKSTFFLVWPQIKINIDYEILYM